METETRIKLVIDACNEMYDSVQSKYAKLKKLGDQAKAERSAMAMNCVNVLNIEQEVNSLNVGKMEDKVRYYQSVFSSRYGSKLKTIVYYEMPKKEEEVLAEVPANVKSDEPTKVSDEKTSGTGEVLGIGLLLALASGLAGAGLANYFNKGVSKNNGDVVAADVSRVLASNNESVVEETENGLIVIRNNNQNGEIANVVSDEEQSINDVVSQSLVLGEYGTFFDASDPEQVTARAQYIYDNYYAGFLSKVSQSERDQVTVNRLANIIRVMYGYCPLNSEGEKKLDANTLDTYGSRFLEVEACIPSSDNMGPVEVVPAYLFAEDGSELQAFLKSYDDLYAQVAEGRNNRNSEQYRKAARILAAKYYTEWALFGMRGNILYDNTTDEIFYANQGVAYSEQYGKFVYYNPETLEINPNVEVYPVTNPYTIDATHRYLAYQGSIARFAPYIKEAEFNQLAAICIPACIDVESKEIQELSISEIYTGIDEGIWNTTIAKSAGIEVQPEPVLVGFWEALNDQLQFDYNNTSTLKLKN